MAKTNKPKKKLSESLEILGDKLSPKQEFFCRLYATEKEFFGNGTDAYAEAYDLDTFKPNWRDVARACASRLLTNANILKRIDQLLEEMGFNDSFVDRELSFLITQKADFGNKLGAIREYNKLKKRIDDNTKVIVNLPTPIYGGKSKPELIKKQNGSKTKATQKRK